jgi:hypothetical protein
MHKKKSRKIKIPYKKYIQIKEKSIYLSQIGEIHTKKKGNHTFSYLNWHFFY